MTDTLATVIEIIGRANDLVEKDKWTVCHQIADAFAELPAYSRGLTAGLCHRLKKSSDMIYSMRDAAMLKDRIASEVELSPSHFAALSHLQDRFNLTDDDVRDWLELAAENGMSVRDMSTEISIKHTEDARKAFLRKIQKIERLAFSAYQESELLQIPDALRHRIRRILALIKSWCERIQKPPA